VTLRNDCNGRNKKLDECAKHLCTKYSDFRIQSRQRKTIGSSFPCSSKPKDSSNIDSLDYFVNHDRRNLLNTNNCVTSDVDPKVFLVYTNIYVGMQEQADHGGGGGTSGTGDRLVTQQECRLRDTT